MTTISHKNLTGAQLHEPKGADTAAINLVYVSSGAGSGTWQKISASQLTTTGNAFGSQLLHAQVTATSGTSGGNPTASAWTKRTLDTTTLTNEITSASISGGVISLPSGTYFAEGSAQFFGTLASKLRLRNTTGSATLLIGSSVYCPPTALTTGGATAIVSGRFTLSGTVNIELQYYVGQTITDGLGKATTSGEVEKYADLKIWKVA